MSQRLIILGASARAAAASAKRAGFDPWTADLFADADLRSFVPNAVRCPVGDYPGGFREILRDAPDAPWIYTGGLENHPNLIRSLGEYRPLWGNGPNVLAACRSPFRVDRILRDAGLPAAEVRGADAELPKCCRWLKKPLKGSGGQGIDFATRGEAGQHYYQQFLKGTSYSAVFVRTCGEVHLLGVTEQLVGPIDWLNAPAFRYAGSFGPIELGPAVREDLLHIGRVLGEGCGLLGLFGVDFVLHADQPHVVEVNPRYTASVEVIERVTDIPTLAWHRLAFDRAATVPTTVVPWSIMCAKAILYASRTCVVPDSYRAWVRVDRAEVNDWFFPTADVPAPGEVIESGWPVLTFLEFGRDRKTCMRRLRQAVYWPRTLLSEPGASGN